MRLTKVVIEHADRPPAGVKERFLRDDLMRGLGVRITAQGGKSFVFEARIKGRPRRLTIGRWPDMNIPQARDKAAEYRAAIARGEDPAQERSAARQEATFAQLIERYLNEYSRPHKKPRSVQNDQYCLSLIPHLWHSRRRSEITRDTISHLQVKIGENHGRYAANHVIRLLRSLFNRGLDWQMLSGPNPAQRLRLFREERRERYLSLDELQRVNAASLEEADWRWRSYFLLALMLGTRKSELLAMRWADLDLSAATWRLPDTKANRSHLLPLPIPGVELLQSLPSRDKSEWVFPSDDSATGHVINPAKAWDRIRNRAGVPDVRIHDLRHSFASRLLAHGYSLSLISKALNHSQISTTQRYAHLDIDPLREALNRTALFVTNGSRPAPGK